MSPCKTEGGGAVTERGAGRRLHAHGMLASPLAHSGLCTLPVHGPVMPLCHTHTAAEMATARATQSALKPHLDQFVQVLLRGETNVPVLTSTGMDKQLHRTRHHLGAVGPGGGGRVRAHKEIRADPLKRTAELQRTQPPPNLRKNCTPLDCSAVCWREGGGDNGLGIPIPTPIPGAFRGLEQVLLQRLEDLDPRQLGRVGSAFAHATQDAH